MGKRSTILVLGIGLASTVAAGARSVEIRLRLDHIAKIASNQVAVWVENEAGAYVGTVFVTDFAAHRQGFKLRPQTLPSWVAAAGVAGWSPQELDAVSGATPQPGELKLVWSCRDAKGATVPDGVYVVRVEGNLYWDATVLCTVRIRVGPQADSAVARTSYHPEDAASIGKLVSDVRVANQP